MTYDRWLVTLVIGVVATGVLVGCSSRALTTPRSEVVADARARGMAVPTVEEDRALFEEFEELNQQRIAALVRLRARGDSKQANYQIGAGDEIEVNVFDVPELNVTAKVRESGFVSLPLIGAVQAIGKTESELSDEIASRLRTFVRDPQVSLYISHYGSQVVAVLGAVRNPGNYPLKKGANSVLEVLGIAGGISEKAGNFLTFIPAEVSGLRDAGDPLARAQLAVHGTPRERVQSSGVELALDQVLGTSGTLPISIPVRGGDIILVPEAGKVMVEGEVQRPGSFDLGQQMTLLSALAASGGITYGAKIDEVEVTRDLPNARKVSLVYNLERIASGEEPDLRLRNGDIVRVPSHPGRRLTQDTFEGISKLINVGVGGTYSVR